MCCIYSDVNLQRLQYTDIYVDGQVDGVEALGIGQDINVIIGEQVCTENNSLSSQ
jgi:hypothetical protein